MSRSTRKPFAYTCFGANPKAGKATTSRALRKAARALARTAAIDGGLDDFFLSDPRDKSRGIAGSRSNGHGDRFFGDGREYGAGWISFYNPGIPGNEEGYEKALLLTTKLCRK